MLSNKDLTLKRVLNADDSVLNLVKETYIGSFPENERRDFSLLLDLLSNDDRFQVYAFYKECKYVGFITCWQLPGYVYVEHFAIAPASRNGGIGGSLFDRFLSLFKDPIVLEVEMPVDDITRRRVGFYKRHGLVLDEHDYLQPPYHESDGWLPLRLMTYGNADLKNNYETVRDSIYRIAYRVSC